MVERLDKHSMVNEEGDVVPFFDAPTDESTPTNAEIIEEAHREYLATMRRMEELPEGTSGMGVAVSLVQRAEVLQRMMELFNQQAQHLGRADKLWRGDKKEREYFDIPPAQRYDEYQEYVEGPMMWLLDKAENMRTEFIFLAALLNKPVELLGVGIPEEYIIDSEAWRIELEREFAYPKMYASERLSIVETVRRTAGLPPLRPKTRRKK